MRRMQMLTLGKCQYSPSCAARPACPASARTKQAWHLGRGITASPPPPPARALMSALRPVRRPQVSLEAQLQQLTLFSDLDSADDNLEQLGPIIKSLDEAGQQDAFLRYLERFIADKDADIERICSDNHMAFVAALDKLLKVRSGTVSLRHRIAELNDEVQTGGSSVADRKRQLLQARRTASNIDDASEIVDVSLRVLKTADTIHGLIADRRYYAALRSLSDLEAVQLRSVAHYEWAKHMLESIPASRDAVKDAVTKEMREWLYQAREKQRTVGRLALDAMDARAKRWKAKAQKDPTLALAKLNSPIEQVVNEKNDNNFVDNEHVSIDFKPLYQAIHIYDVLGHREALQRSYQEDRAAQASLLLSQGLSFDPTRPTFPALLEEVVGFFLVEHHVLQTAPAGWRSEQDVDDLWDTFCDRVVNLVRTGLQETTDTNVFVTTKNSIILFIQTLEGYNYSVSQLNTLLVSLFSQYSKLLRTRFRNDFQQAVAETEQQPMVVSNSDELRKVINVCWLQPGDAERLREQPFPLTLPFAQTYPLCCMDIRQLVDEYYSYVGALAQPHHRQLDDVLKASLDELLIQRVGASVRRAVERTTNLAQVAQIVVTAEHFKLAAKELERLFIALRAPATGRASARRPLDLAAHFDASLTLANKRIDTATTAKLGQSLDVEEFDTQPRAARRQVADHLPEMLVWLTTMMESVLAPLPYSSKHRAYENAFRYIAEHLARTCLLNEREQLLNQNAIRNLMVDVAFLQEHASKFSTAGEADFGNAFNELSQTLQLILKNQAGDYAHSATLRAQRFPDVRPATLCIVIDKLARYHAGLSGKENQDIANSLYRTRDSVARLIRR